MSKLNKEVQVFHTWCYTEGQIPEYKTLRYDLIDAILYGGFKIRVNSSGTVYIETVYCINQSDFPSRVQYAHDRNTKVIAQFWTSYDSVTETDKILSDPVKRTAVINQLLQLVKSNNLDGVDNDIEKFEAINTITGKPNREYITAFMKELSEKFWVDNPNYRISMDVGHKDRRNAWDLPVLQNYVNYMMLMSYTYTYSKVFTYGRAYPEAPICDVRDGIKYMVARMDKKKILVGVSYEVREWQTVDDKRNSLMIGDEKEYDYDQKIDKITNQYGRKWDKVYKSPWYAYQDSTGKWYQGTYQDQESLGIEYDFVNSEDIGGIGVFVITSGTNRPELWQIIADKFNIGSLYINSNPTGARIYIDNIDSGENTPKIIPNLPSGLHTYKLTKTGYISATDSFNIIAGQIVEISVNLIAPVNLVLNPGFEIGTTGKPTNWSKNQSGTIAIWSYPETGRLEGSSVAIEYTAVETNKYADYYQSISIDASKTYEFSWYMKTNNIITGAGGGAHMSVNWFDAARVKIGQYNSTRQTGTMTWTYFTEIFTPPSGTAYAQIILILRNCSGKVWFDDISFTEMVK